MILLKRLQKHALENLSIPTIKVFFFFLIPCILKHLNIYEDLVFSD